MLKGHEQFRIPDLGKARDFTMEVNWEPKDEKTNDCKVVRFTFPDGTQADVNTELLHAVLFAIGNPEAQRKLIPQVEQRVRWYETVVSVKAKKDIRKGENLTFPIKLSLPLPPEYQVAERPQASHVLKPR